MALTRITANETSAIADLNQFADHLEGVAGNTLAWLLRVATSENFVVILSDNAGSSKFLVKDLSGATVATIDSDGNLTITGGFTPGSLTLPSAAAPAPTTDGQIIWDSDDNRIAVGDGASTQVFYPGLPDPTYKYRTAQLDLTTTTLADVAATSGNVAFAVAASTAYRLRIRMVVSALGTAGSGGLKLALTGPTSPTRINYITHTYQYVQGGADSNTDNHYPAITSVLGGSSVTAFPTFLNQVSAASIAHGSAGGLATGLYEFEFFIVNGSTAGTVTLQAAQNTAAGTSSITTIDAVMERLQAA